ncbi:ATP-binding cassette domain-containing protein [Carboxylicivirga linearis]|uniref:ATP-binding cassette domain-containing protein n=1 Tax=Carboxylicivirga linearis TaxID=1628157 RepID=A0ABS5JXT6_9BACT|nr:ATP-binding cassette domain-containing protein [Carboxylicivirga linearis]MBS2099649.1 ATP-binding cassette domain-containing protein [Carboxylicivirga linearis]
MPFPISIHSHLLGEVIVDENQYIVIHTKDTQLISDFLLWIEGAKRFENDQVIYQGEAGKSSSLYKLKKHLKVLRFQLKSKLVGDYYQQRYHATENDDLLSLAEFLGEISDVYLISLMHKFGLDKLMDEKINMLSTGEFKKALAIKAACENTKLLIVEEPGIGVDSGSREHLHELFRHLAQHGKSVIVCTSTSKWSFKSDQLIERNSLPETPNTNSINHIHIPEPSAIADYTNVFELKDIVVTYNNRNVLDEVNWAVKKNDKWALSGKNGAGKSTLLSVIYADNPQSYSNEVYSFGNRRGAGQSIWDVKERIGFYSSELHRYTNKRQMVEDVIRSLAIQNPYKKRPLSEEELKFRDQLLSYFGIEKCLNEMFYELSVVRQKLVILCGVLVKNAPLLILDEPFQGFSDELVLKAQLLIEKYTSNRTFIMVSHDRSYPKSINRCFHLENGVGKEICLQEK